jgi:transcriptional regulator with XRE-family HTH domain
MGVWKDAAVSDYGTRLVALRKARRLSRYKAALAMGIHNETLKDAEEGLRAPREETRQILGNFYGVDPDTLTPLQSTSAIDSVQPSAQGEDYSPREGDDMTEDKARRAQQLLMALPLEMRSRAVAFILELNHQASVLDMADLGKEPRPKEGSG